MSQKLAVEKGGKTLIGKLRGCSPKCEDTSQIVVCPTCNKWACHVNCINRFFIAEGIPAPDFTDERVKWKCMECQWLFYSVFSFTVWITMVDLKLKQFDGLWMSSCSRFVSNNSSIVSRPQESQRK